MQVALGIIQIPNVSLWETAPKISGTISRPLVMALLTTLKTEAELLFARAGKLHVITWYCTSVFIFKKIMSTGNDTHFMVSKKKRKFLCYIILISRSFPTKLVGNNFS